MKAGIRRTNIFRWSSEEFTAVLAQIKDLKVIGRSSSFRFKDRKEETKTIGEKLGVATLLEGTVRRGAGANVAELINAADGIELWTRTFDRELRTFSPSSRKSRQRWLRH
jgi:serine/threonine-protein kinase